MNPHLRVLHVFCGPFPSPQGTQTLVSQTCEILQNANVDTHLLCYAHGVASDVQQSYTVHRISDVPQFRSERSGPAWAKIPLDAAVSISVRKLLRQLKPDIVHAHHYEALLACRMAQLRSTTPLLFHQHAAFESELSTYVSPAFRTPLRLFGTATDRYLPLLATHTVAISEANFRQLRHFLPDTAVTLIRPPACTPPPDRIEPKETNHITAVYMGNLDAYQNIGTMLDAVQMLPLPIKQQFRLKIVTASSTASLAQRIISCAPSLEFVSHGPFENAWRALCSADFSIVPRNAPGGVPIKLINTFAAGVPVIADAGIMPELSSDEALLIDTRSPRQMTRAIERMITDASYRQSLRQNSSRTLTRHFSPLRYTRQMIRLYRSLSLKFSSKH